MALLIAPAIDMLINSRNSAGGLNSPKYMANMHKAMAGVFFFFKDLQVFSGETRGFRNFELCLSSSDPFEA